MKPPKYHYFYKISNLLNEHFYYGVHSTDNLEDGYMGSGQRLKYAYKKYGMQNFKKEILKFFDSKKEAFEYEAEMVTEELVKNPDCYNIQLGGKGWNTNGLVNVRDKDGNCFLVPKDDPRYLSGELSHVAKGLVTVKDKDGNCFDVKKVDPRYLSGELVRATKGIIIVKDKNGNKFSVSVDDPRYLSGELVGVTKGLVAVKDKSGNYFMVPKDDQRYLSGELVGVCYGRKHSEETKRKMRETAKLTGKQKGEKNSQYGKCWVHNDKESISIKKEDLETYLQHGYIKGMKLFKPMEEYKYVKNKGVNHPQYGSCWIHNDRQSILIKKEELETYLQQGYIKGRKMFKK